ncbi:MAG TPA: branched-chain amino acid ABC transporter permease [Rubrivivax sp.]|nr:branched-chain amino acid ABC transporter permease [Burkholderiales bacterium]HNT39410.1 branched-chain amino acid ABC transporter permease [Rubrivivax sp.]
MATGSDSTHAGAVPAGAGRAPAAPRIAAGSARAARTRALALLAAALVVIPFLFPNSYFYEVAVLVLMNAVVCLGLNLLIGYAGQISLGHAAFFALGGYGSAILAANHGWPTWLSLPVTVAAIGVLAAVVGKPTLRFKGHYLAMATLGLGVIVNLVLTNEDRLTGGPDGMSVPPLAIMGYVLSGEKLWYGIAAVVLWASVWLATNLIDSPVGRALRAVHGSEVAGETVGIVIARWKLAVFVISALLAALAGALMAHYSGFITPSKSSFLHSVELVIMVVFGGMASIWGAIVGAAVLTLLPQLLTVFKDYETMVFGGVLIATMIFFPRGIVPTLARLWSRRSGSGSKSP